MAYRTVRDRLGGMLPRDQREKLADLDKKYGKAAVVHCKRGVHWAESEGEMIVLETVGQRAMRFCSAGITGSHADTNLHMEDRTDIIPFLDWVKQEKGDTAAKPPRPVTFPTKPRRPMQTGTPGFNNRFGIPGSIYDILSRH